MALSIDDEMGFATQAIAASRGGEDFSAAYRAERCVPGQLPTLCHGDGRANAGVTARADAESETLDFLAVDLSLFEGLLDQDQRAGLKLIGRDFAQHIGVIRDGYRPFLGAEFKRQYLHNE